MNLRRRRRLCRSCKWDIPKTHRNIRLGADPVFDDGPPAYGAKIDVLLKWLFSYVTWIVDLFDYKYFDGDPPSRTQRVVIPVTQSAPVVERS